MVATIGDAQQVPDPRVADLIRAGQIRVGLFPPQYTKDPVTGELKSVWVEIARALAARIGVQVVLLEYPAPPQVVDCLKADACDVVFLPFDSRAAEVGGFSSPFIEFDFTYLVPAGSLIQHRRCRQTRDSHRGRAQSRLDGGSEPRIEASQTGVRRDPRPHFRPAAHRRRRRDGISP
jgi:ABC-type amino acid transport substrate-binding protein